jgi:hypothetical protein
MLTHVIVKYLTDTLCSNSDLVGGYVKHVAYVVLQVTQTVYLTSILARNNSTTS